MGTRGLVRMSAEAEGVLRGRRLPCSRTWASRTAVAGVAVRLDGVGHPTLQIKTRHVTAATSTTNRRWPRLPRTRPRGRRLSLLSVARSEDDRRRSRRVRASHAPLISTGASDLHHGNMARMSSTDTVWPRACAPRRPWGHPCSDFDLQTLLASTLIPNVSKAIFMQRMLA